MPTCEYCGEDFTKGGAYATHVRYCDARPEQESTGEDDEPADSVRADTGGESAAGIEVEISDDATAGRTATSETATDTDAVEHSVESGRHGDSQPGSHSGSSGQRIAAVGLILLGLVIWRLLARNEE